MASDRFILFVETLEGFIDYTSDKFLGALRRTLKDPHYAYGFPLERYSPDIINDMLFKGVLRYMFDKPGKGCPKSAPDETVAELLRRGVPKESVHTGKSNVTVYLPHANYRLDRADNGYLPGTVRVSKKGSSIIIGTEYTPKEMAEFFLLLDPLIPRIDKAAEALYRKMDEELRRKEAADKAQEILRKSIQTQLDAVLPGLGITCTFKVSEDGEKVHLELTRRLTADIDIPQPELHDFLADPEKVLSTLQVSLK